jgi:hypothetical protein
VSPYGEAQERPAGNVTKLIDYRYGDRFGPARESLHVGAGENAWHTLVIEADGDRITTFVGDTRVDEFRDAKQPYRSGGIALVCRGDSIVQFQQIMIQELANDGDEGEPARRATGKTKRKVRN